MGTPSHLKTYLCIDYPALVKNESEAIRTLGGMQRLNQTFSRRNTKLLLNFTPDNIFSKMLCSSQINEIDEEATTKSSKTTSKSESASTSSASASAAAENNLDDDLLDTSSAIGGGHTTSHSNSANSSNMPRQNEFLSMPCLIMSVKKNSSQDNKFDVKIIAKVKKVYTFQKIADFQYLPMSCHGMNRTTPDDSTQDSASSSSSTKQYNYTSFYDNFLFNNIHDYKHEFERNNLPQLFILPPFFSRFDDPVSYSYRSETAKRINGSEAVTTVAVTTTAAATSEGEDTSAVAAGKGDPELIRSMRQERSSQAILVTFKVNQIPTSRRIFFLPDSQIMIYIIFNF